MPEQERCWVCHRSQEEVSTFADMETPKEVEIIQRKSQLTRFRADFIQTVESWRKGLPKELKEYDFNFVTSNADQFKPIKISNGLLGEIVPPNKLLGEIVDAKKLTFDWLGNVAVTLRTGEGEVPGFGALSHFDKAERDLLNRMVGQFEAKWRRRIGSERSGGGDSNGYETGFEGLKLFDGLEFMIAVGTLYYDVQAQLLDMAKRKEVHNKPKRGVSVLLVSGFPPIPLCSVCVEVMGEVGSNVAKAATPHIMASSGQRS